MSDARLNTWLRADEAPRPRFESHFGEIYENIGERAVWIDLREAVARYEEWGRDAVTLDQHGNRPLAKVVAHDALALSMACSVAVGQRQPKESAE